MLWLKRIIILCFIICTFLVGLVFLTANEEPLSLSFFLFEITTTSGAVFVLGLIIGLLAALIGIYPLIAVCKYKLRRIQKNQHNFDSTEKTVVP